MKLIKNSGNERVIDELRKCLVGQANLDIASPALVVFCIWIFGNFYARIIRNITTVNLE